MTPKLAKGPAEVLRGLASGDPEQLRQALEKCEVIAEDADRP